MEGVEGDGNGGSAFGEGVGREIEGKVAEEKQKRRVLEEIGERK